MIAQTRLTGLIIAGSLALSSAVLAQEAYPDLRGSWVGPGQSVTLGQTDQWPAGEPGAPVFRQGSWTVILDQQEGSLVSGTQGLTDGDRRDPLLGVIRGDRATILMVDDDGTFTAVLTGPDAMEMCRTEVTDHSQLVGCRQLTRQK